MTSKLASGLSLSSFRIEGEGQNPYLNDARLHTCLLLQRVIFEKQSKKFASILATQSDKTSSRISVEDFNASLPSNNILKRRNMTDDNQSQKRLLDDIEMTLLGILDSDNCISLASRLSDFILLMTRITRLDHRALCLHILGNSLSPACSKQFLADGGFKILKRWIKQAGLEDNVDELCTIVMLCAKLPFDKDAAKQTQIGKYIKKFLKYKSASNQDTTKLCKEIDYLIKTWYEAFSDAVKEQLNAAPENPAQENVQPSKISTTIVATLAQRLFEDRGPPKVFLPFVDISATELPPAAPVAADHKVVDLANPAAPGRTSNPLAAAPAKTPASAAAAAAAAAAKKPATATTTQNPTLASAKPASHTQPAVHSIKKIDNPSATATKPSSTAVDSSASASSSSNEADSGNKPTQSAATAAASTLTRTAKVPAGKINMAEQARKVAAQKQAQELAASAARDANISRPASNRGNDIDPGRSILKRMSDSTDGPSSKRAKLDVKFADDHGKDIAEVQYFEVEFLKRSWVGEKSKKSHKEMMKRERMIEKNDLMTKNRSSMQRTTDWSTPAPLVLSLEITENSHNPITSPESEEQNKRIQHTLEARYVDESLIPLDPDEVAGMADDEAPDTRVIYIEWETENVMNQPAVGSLQHVSYRLCFYLSLFSFALTIHCLSFQPLTGCNAIALFSHTAMPTRS